MKEPAESLPAMSVYVFKPESTDMPAPDRTMTAEARLNAEATARIWVKYSVLSSCSSVNVGFSFSAISSSLYILRISLFRKRWPFCLFLKELNLWFSPRDHWMEGLLFFYLLFPRCSSLPSFDSLQSTTSSLWSRTCRLWCFFIAHWSDSSYFHTSTALMFIGPDARHRVRPSAPLWSVGFSKERTISINNFVISLLVLEYGIVVSMLHW